MKKFASSLLVLAVAFCVLFSLLVNASAASVGSQDGLEAAILTDKTEYASDEEVSLTISIKNTNAYVVEGVSIETIIPEGLRVKSGDVDFDNISIPAKGTYKTPLITVVEQSEEAPEVEEVLKPEDDQASEGDYYSDGNLSAEGTYDSGEASDSDDDSKSEKPSKGKNPSKGEKPSKGDKPSKSENSSENEETSGSENNADKIDSAKEGKASKIILVIVLISVAVVCVVLAIKHKKSARVLSIFLCMALLLNIVPLSAFSADDDTATIELDKTISVSGKECTIKCTVEYTKHQDLTDDGIYSRSEWIGLLAEKLNMNLSVDADSIDFYYEDIRNDANAIAIETAQAYGLLPQPKIDDLEQDVPKFYPNARATREFVAYTVARAKGFTNHSIDTSSWKDKKSITYKDEAAIAVEFNFLKLKNNKFRPNSSISDSDIERIFEALDLLDSSIVVTEENAHDDAKYQKGVIKDSLATIVDYTVKKDGESYTVKLPLNEDTEAIKRGNIIVLPGNEAAPGGCSFKVKDKTEMKTVILLECVEPKLSEVFKQIDFAGKGTPLTDSFVPAEGVSYNYKANDTLKLTVHEKDVVDNSKVSGKIEIEIPDVTCILNAKTEASELDVEELTYSIQEKIKLKGSLKYALAESGYELADGSGNTTVVAGSVELGRLPVVIGSTGFTFDIVFFYNVEAKGTASITYTMVSKQGYQYKNNAARTIFSFDDSLEQLKLKGSAKAGVGIVADLNALNTFDIIGYSTEFGIGVNAPFTARALEADTLYCSDANLYAYAGSALDKETVAGHYLDEKLHYTLEFEHLKNVESNPLKRKLHLENGEKVDVCTFGVGGISGYVYDTDTNEPLENARIKLCTAGDTSGANVVRVLYTDANGKFDTDNLYAGDYMMFVSVTDYITYSSQVSVKAGEYTYLETLMMVERDNTGKVKVSGTIKDAVTGGGLAGTSYTVRADWYNTTGAIVSSGAFKKESYTIKLRPGNYTLEVKKEGYVTNFINIAVGSDAVANADVVLSPEDIGSFEDAQSLRIVLTWGEHPRDLDSHFYGPAVNGSFHTYYWDKSHHEDEILMADLDVDDTSSYGPETTTAHVLKENGTYSYLVHDFTNRNNYNSKKMSMSGAKVQVYVGDVCAYTFNVPMNTGGTVWHVFDYNAETGEVIAVNKLWYQSNPQQVLS